jgi:hypothetical protein
MDRRTYLTTLGAAVTGAATTGLAAANDHPVYRPGGPWPGQLQAINLNGLLTNEQLADRLQQIDRRSDRLELRRIGESAGQNAPIWEATVGTGDTNVHLITQIHGDEPVGTEVAVDLLRELALSDSRQVRSILDELTLTVVPRVNPDGAMFHYDVDDDGRSEWVGRRTNTQRWNAGDSRHEPWYHYTYPTGTTPGYDMNRDFNIRPPSEFDPRTDTEPGWWSQVDGDWYLDMPYEGYTLLASGLRLAPEIRAVTRSYLDADPDVAITHHHQGAYLVPDSGSGSGPADQTVMSVMGQYGPAYLDRSPFYDPDTPIEQVVNPFVDAATSTRSLRLNALVANALADRGNSVFDTITRYSYLPLWGSYLDALTPHTDAAGMLYEVSYQTDDRGQMSLGRMVEATRVGFVESLDALATETLDQVSASDYFDIPTHGQSLDNPHLTMRRR